MLQSDIKINACIKGNKIKLNSKNSSMNRKFLQADKLNERGNSFR